MKIKIGLIILFSGIYGLNAYAASGRDLIIQNEIDCIDQNNSNGLTWKDICYTPESSQEQHIQIVNQELDQMEGVPPQAVKEEPQPVKEEPQPVKEESQLVNQEPQIKKRSINVFNDRVNTFDLNYQTFYSHYSESQKARTVTGVWGGVEGKYILRPPQGNILSDFGLNYYAVESLYGTGKNDVDKNLPGGEVLNPPTFKVYIKDIPGYMFDDRILLGRDFDPLTSIRLTPYTGFGVRYKTDHSAGHYDVYQDYLGSPVVALGYDFSDLYYYIPAGINFDLAAHNGYEISLNTEFDFLVRGYERDDFSDFDQYTVPGAHGFANQNLRYTFHQGGGFRSSLKFLKHLSLVDIYFEPYIRYWHINASKIVSGSVGGGEYTATANKNSTVEAGSSLGIQF